MANEAPDYLNCDVLGTSVKNLHVGLTEEEVSKRGQQLAIQLRNVTELEAEHKDALKNFKAEQKAEMGEATTALYTLRDAVNERRELRPVTIVFMADFGKGIHMTLREDTSELVEKRALLADETQVQLPIPLRVVVDNTGRLTRTGGASLDTLPFVRQEHCGKALCQECASRHGTEHEDGCDFRGDGDAKLVNGDQTEERKCKTCDAPLNSHHEEGCKHLGEGQ